MPNLKQHILLSLTMLLVISLSIFGLHFTSNNTPSINTAQAQTAYGPRGAVGPDVPLTSAEQTAFANRVEVTGSNTAAIVAAINQAVSSGKHVVYLPARVYTMETYITVPANITLLGAGSGTVLKNTNPGFEAFFIGGDNVRFTRMKIEGGASSAWVPPNGGKAITSGAYDAGNHLNTRIDHMEILGWAYDLFFTKLATVQIDHNMLHHNLVESLGYAVVVALGSYVLVTDNEIHDSRANISATFNNGAPTSVTRLTHLEIRNNKFQDIRTDFDQAIMDAHSSFQGTFVLEKNSFEHGGPWGIIFQSGSGLVQDNFINVYTAFTIRLRSENGTIGTPHDIYFDRNVFGPKTVEKYRIEAGKNIKIDGTIMPSTIDNSVSQPPIPIIYEMGADGVLRWDPDRSKVTATPTPVPTPTPTTSSTPISPSAAAITLVKAVDKITAVSGDILTYTLTVKNTSTTVKANPVKITDTLPTGTTFVSVSNPESGGIFANGKVSWDFVGGLGPGQITTVTFQVKVGSTTSNTATLAITPTTVTVGSKVTVTVSNASGNSTSWVGLYATGTTNNDLYKDWQHLNGTKTPPTTGLTSATLTFTMPTTAGSYEFRLFDNTSGYTLLATSPPVTVN
jgi:uncharacterized repeat protein (TIGR01451 family)